jgi:hypothetical protein
MSLSFDSADHLAQALGRAGAAHGVYEEALGQGRDEQWPAWYANHVEQEQAGAEAGSPAPRLRFESVDELAAALLRAERAHAEHQQQTGREEPDWATWYAEYFEREQSGGGATA